MQIAVENGQYRLSTELVPGDTILAASVDSATGELVWSAIPVEFSQGAGDSTGQSLMLLILFKPEGQREDYLIVSRNQLFYMSDGKLRKAATLVPGLDTLRMADGREAPIVGIATSIIQRGSLHYVATSRVPAPGVDGHLINIKGVVCGDYALQISDIGRTVDNEVLPLFGTEEYIARYSAHITGDSSHAIATRAVADEQTDVMDNFQVLISDCTQPVNQYFFTEKQAQDIKDNPDTKWRPESSHDGIDTANYLIRLYSSHYPDIDFVLHMEDLSVNAFAVFKNNQKHVQIPRGLVNMEAVKFESLAVIMAHCIARFIDMSPENEEGYACMGLADYLGVDAIVRTVWYGSHFDEIMFPAMEQLDKIFDLIVPASDREGAPGNTCTNISTNCRLETMAAAMTDKPLPACAGGN
jgi:hypothetical protein